MLLYIKYINVKFLGCNNGIADIQENVLVKELRAEVFRHKASSCLEISNGSAKREKSTQMDTQINKMWPNVNNW